ncbi:MAG: queuosine precursor transporter [Rhizorhabdus sp.]
METSPAPAAIPRSLFIFSIFYGGMVCIAGVLGNKLVALGPLAVESGIFAFLLLVVTSSAVAEAHGREVANKLVLFGFIPLVFAAILIELVLALPPAEAMDAERLSAFGLILGQSARMMVAGLIAYGISQMLNVTIFSALKKGAGQLLWLRAAIASVASQIIDTLLFITIAFYGVFPIGGILVGQMLAKVVLSILLVPALVYLFLAIGRKLDRRAL